MISDNFTIIGGGLVGLATAWRVLQRAPKAKVVLLEKEAGVGRHQSTHNSGVLHCGLHYRPGSHKARLAVAGVRQMVQFCRENNVPHDVCGKLVVATDEAQVTRLRTLHVRGQANGLSGLRWMTPAEFRQIEPHAAGLAALHVPEEGIADYAKVVETLARKIQEMGGTIQTDSKVTRIRRHGNEWLLDTPRGEVAAKFVINCAGLHSEVTVSAEARANEPSSERLRFAVSITGSSLTGRDWCEISSTRHRIRSSHFWASISRG
jgi:(S)-2-hydroxyglutarate dehydrogenase